VTPETYAIEVVAGRSAIRCLFCDRVSELPGDVANRYCGRCHLFHDLVREARLMLARFQDGTHECSEWRTYRHQCALCGASLPPRAREKGVR